MYPRQQQEGRESNKKNEPALEAFADGPFQQLEFVPGEHPLGVVDPEPVSIRMQICQLNVER